MLKVTNLCKSYPTFRLKNVSFELPKGYIMGFLGTNGAGKTTTLKSILNIIHPDSGEIEILSKPILENELEIKQKIGFMLGEFNYFPKSKISQITSIYSAFYPNWDNNIYQNYLKRFNIDENKKISDLSAGMKVKYGLTLALSHKAKLLILDEPTSGLDPIARDDLLDLFREIIEDEETSILFSTHITSDLDKCADYIIMIKNGEIIANSTKDELIDNNALISGKKSQLTEDLKQKMIGFKEHTLNFKGLIAKQDLKNFNNLVVEKPNLEDIMVYYNLEVKNENNK